MKKDSKKGQVAVLGIDLAKKSFQLHGVDKSGNTVLRKKLNRNQLSAFVALPDWDGSPSRGSKVASSQRPDIGMQYSSCHKRTFPCIAGRTIYDPIIHVPAAIQAPQSTL